MTERKRIIVLTTIVVFACLLTAAVTLWVQFGNHVETLREQLQITVKAKARLIESVYQQELTDSEFHTDADPEDYAIEATLRQVRSSLADISSFGETGEFLLARKAAGDMVFVARSRGSIHNEWESILRTSDEATPILMALKGASGTMIGDDYRGREVLAAYEALSAPDLGLVVTIEMAEIKSSFISSSLIAIPVTAGLALVFLFLVRRISNPVIRKLENHARRLETEAQKREKSEAALRREIEIVRQAETTANLGYWYWERDVGTVTWSDNFCRICGVEPGQLSGSFREILRFVHPDDVDLVRKEARKVLSEPDLRTLEYRIVTPGGVEKHVRGTQRTLFKDGEIRGYVGTLQDITEQVQAENELKESVVILEASQRVANLGSYVLDTSTGAWTSSAIMDSVFGIGPDFTYDIQGWMDIVHPDDRQEMLEYFQNEVIGNSQPFDREYRIIRLEDGKERRVHGLGELRFDKEGNVTTMIGTIRDITDQKRLEQERLDLERQMQQAQKLESLGVLAGGIAHDFNNLLMTILGNSDLALQDLSPHAPSRNSIEAIETATRRAAGLAQQMLAYSGKGHFVRERIEINEVVEETTHLLEVATSKTASLKYDLTDNLPSIEGDSTQIRQVLMNLIINASEAIGGETGVVSISTGAMECTAEYLNTSEVPGNPLGEISLSEGLYIYFEVADTGCGMDRETLERVFDPFFTTKFTGRGLGMAATLGIVRSHKGAIKVDTEPGKGSSFKILFPANPADMDQAETDKDLSSEKSDGLGKGTILIVDDEESIRTIGKQMLERLGFEVLTAEDGVEAVRLFRDNPDQIKCVLLDLTMPKMDGREAFRELQRLRKDAKIIICSGYNEQKVTEQFAGQGLAGFLQKPYQSGELGIALKKVFRD